MMKVQMVKLSDVYRYDNTRAEASDLSDLMASIKERGVLQPIVVAPNFLSNSKKEYVLCCGNRRFLAVQKLGDTEITAVINTSIVDEKDLIITNLSENIQRKDVSAFEQGRFIHKLINDHGMINKECAARLGITLTLVNNLLMAYTATPKEFQDKVVHGDRTVKKGFIPLCSAVKLNNMRKSNLINAKEQRKLFKAISEKKFTNANLQDFNVELKKGVKTLDKIIEARKPTILINVNVPVYITERDKLLKNEDSMTSLVEKILYGES